MKSKEIADLSIKEIELKITEYNNRLLGLRVRKQAGQVEKPHQFKEIRRAIARLKTFLRQKTNN